MAHRSAGSEHRPVAVDRERRLAAAQPRRGLAPRRPRPPFEDAGERQVGTAKLRAHVRGQLVDERDGERAPLDDELAADRVPARRVGLVAQRQHAGVEQQPAVAVLGQRGERVALDDAASRALERLEQR